MNSKLTRRLLSLLLCAALLASLLLAVSAADGLVLTADFAQKGHELRHLAMGCLYGLGEEDVPSSNLLTPIHPYTFEQKAPDGLQHPCGDAVLTAKTFLESGGQWIQVGCPDIKANWYYEESPFQNQTNYDLYKRQLAEMAEKCVNAGLSGHCVYNIFNETDGNWSYSNAQWFAAWKDFVETIRAVDPLARFSGPGFANYSGSFIRDWLQYCAENDCAPWQVTIHSLVDDRYRSMEREIAEIRSYCAEAGITDYEVCANEYGHHENLGNPAGLIKYVATLEDNEASGCLAFWHVGNALDDLAADANEPNGAWWMYKMYADMRGTTVKCSTTADKFDLYGLASIDEQGKTAYALFGGNNLGSESLQMTGLDKTVSFGGARYALVTLRSTSYSGTYGPAAEPTVVYRRVLPIENGTVTVPVSGANAETVWYVTAIPVDKASDPNETEGPWRATYEAESVSGASTVSSNTSYPASGGKLANLASASASLTFRIEVPQDGYYALRTVYGMETGSNPNNMNSHSPVMGSLDVSIDGAEPITVTLDNTLQRLTCDNVVIYPYLTAGSHTVKLQPNAASKGFPLIDCLNVRYDGAQPHSFDQTYEAEEASVNVLGGLKSSPVRAERELSGFTGIGYVTGLSLPVYEGAGIRFAVCTEEEGMYSLRFRCRSDESAKLGLYLHNTALSLYNKVTDVKVPKSASWQEVTTTLYLEKGMNLIDVDASSAALALDSLRVTPCEAKQSTVIEAESCVLSGNVRTAASSYASGGSYVRGPEGKQDGSNAITLSVTVPTACKYQLDLHHSNSELFGNHGTNVAMVDRYFTVSVNDGRAFNVVCRNTYSADCFRVKTVTVELKKGENTIRLWNDDARVYYRGQGYATLLDNYAPNLDKLVLTPITDDLLSEEHTHETALRDYKAPTCTLPGFSGDKVCVLCGATVELGAELPPTGHTLVLHEAQEPGCETEGWEAYKSCENCNYSTYAPLAPLGHSWDEGELTTQPTQEAPGVRTLTCTRCGDIKTQKVPRLGPMQLSDIDFTDPDAADAFTILNRQSAAIAEGAGLALTCSRPAFEPCNGQNEGEQATNPEDVVVIPVSGDWVADLTVDFDTNGASNGYYQFFGFYARQGEDFNNLAGIRGGDGAMQDFLRIGGSVTADTDGVKSSPGFASNGVYYLRLEKNGTTYICSRSDNGETFTEMFRYEDIGIEADSIVLDAYTGMTAGYKFTVKSLKFGDASVPPLDRVALDRKIAQAETLSSKDYTEESFAALIFAIDAAKQARDAAVTQSELNRATNALNAALRALEERPEEPPVDPPFRFDDVKDAKKFYYEPVYWAVDNGVTTGATDTTFDPMGDCTRAHVVTFLWRAAGKPEPQSGDSPFTDLNPKGFYYKAVLWAVEKGITNGITATTFEPGTSCTRGQIVTFLWRCKNSAAPESNENPFGDVKDTAFYYRAVLWAVQNGVTTGVSDGVFAPNDTCTRGQVVTFLYRTEHQ